MHPMGGLSPKDLDSVVDALTQTAWNHEGATYHLSGEAWDASHVPHLWAVGRPAQSLQVGPEVVSSDLVRAWVTDVLLLDHLCDAFGVWWDKDAECAVFDAVDFYPEEVLAVAEARSRGEAAIYDLATDLERFV